MSEILRPPISKSDAHRALVLADICGIELALPDSLPRDVVVLRDGLRALRKPTATIECFDAGAPFRFLLTQAALKEDAHIEFTGTARLAERPHRALMTALERALGLAFPSGTLQWPLTLETRKRHFQGPFRVHGAESSQFVSSLILGAARLVREGERPVSVLIEGTPTSMGYLDLTVGWLERFGFEVETGPSRMTVVSRAEGAAPKSIPGDWSSLTYLLPLAWKGGVEVEGVDRQAAHPDRLFVEYLERAGLVVRGTQERSTVTGSLSRAISADASVCPDSIPALVAVALVAPGPSTFTHCNVLRLKESNRLEALAELVQLVGGQAKVANNTLEVVPPQKPRGGAFEARDDHRLVMAAAVAGFLLGVPLSVTHPNSVAKSFPGFWLEGAKVGLDASGTG